MSSGPQVTCQTLLLRLSVLLVWDLYETLKNGRSLPTHPSLDVVATDPHEVIIRDGQGRDHRLSRYSAHWCDPRPECSTIVSKHALEIGVITV
jgi:hypothetical protein